MEARRFRIVRKTDVIGITGSGVICDGIEWPDGSATTKYRGPVISETSWPRGVEDLKGTLLNPKAGNTELVWCEDDVCKSLGSAE